MIYKTENPTLSPIQTLTSLLLPINRLQLHKIIMWFGTSDFYFYLTLSLRSGFTWSIGTANSFDNGASKLLPEYGAIFWESKTLARVSDLEHFKTIIFSVNLVLAFIGERFTENAIRVKYTLLALSTNHMNNSNFNYLYIFFCSSETTNPKCGRVIVNLGGDIFISSSSGG